MILAGVPLNRLLKNNNVINCTKSKATSQKKRHNERNFSWNVFLLPRPICSL